MKLSDILNERGQWGDWTHSQSGQSVELDKCCHFGDEALEQIQTKVPYNDGWIRFNYGRPGFVGVAAPKELLKSAWRRVIMPKIDTGEFTSAQIEAIDPDTYNSLIDKYFRISDNKSIKEIQRWINEL